MIGQRNTFFSCVVTNPLVWIGLIIAFLHLHSLKDNNVWSAFLEPTTYRNLLIGSTIWSLIFDRHYTKNREHLDIIENLCAIITNAYIILVAWGVTIFAISQYHATGNMYSQNLRNHLQTQKQTQTKASAPALATPQNLNLETGKKYKITPSSDGSFTIEVISQ